MSFGVPVIILKEGTEETREKEARQQNINAMVAIAETIRSTLGPKGMAKMIVDGLGDTTITNDGAEILKALDFCCNIYCCSVTKCFRFNRTINSS